MLTKTTTRSLFEGRFCKPPGAMGARPWWSWWWLLLIAILIGSGVTFLTSPQPSGEVNSSGKTHPEIGWYQCYGWALGFIRRRKPTELSLCFLTVDMIWPAPEAPATATSHFPATDRLCSFSQGGFIAATERLHSSGHVCSIFCLHFWKMNGPRMAMVYAHSPSNGKVEAKRPWAQSQPEPPGVLEDKPSRRDSCLKTQQQQSEWSYLPHEVTLVSHTLVYFSVGLK